MTDAKRRKTEASTTSTQLGRNSTKMGSESSVKAKVRVLTGCSGLQRALSGPERVPHRSETPHAAPCAGPALGQLAPRHCRPPG